MPLKLFIASPHNTGKSTTAFALADKLNAHLIFPKLSGSPVPRGIAGPFVIDDLSHQTIDLQRWVLHNLLYHDFYLFCNSSYLDTLYPPLKRFLENHYPEAFL